jgi:hypothetical protein
VKYLYRTHLLGCRIADAAFADNVDG